VVADSISDTACVFLASLHRAERAIAERLQALVSGTLPWPWIDAEKALPWVEQRTNLTLAESQKTADVTISSADKPSMMRKGGEKYVSPVSTFQS
jgi:hypothetical protein